MINTWNPRFCFWQHDDFNFYITNFSFLSSNIPSSPAYGVFISQLIRYARTCPSYECFILRAVRLTKKLLGQGYVKERLKSSLRNFYGRYGDLTKQYEVHLSRIVTRHSRWWPHTVTASIDRTLHQLLTVTDLDLITEFDFLPNCATVSIETHTTGAACQQRTLTPPDTWSRPTLGLACVLISRPISPELVLSPDFWISNIPRYFSLPYIHFICIHTCRTDKSWAICSGNCRTIYLGNNLGEVK